MSKKHGKKPKNSLARRVARLEDAQRRERATLKAEVMRAIHHALSAHEGTYHREEQERHS